MSTDLCFTSATELVRLIKARQLSPVDLVEAYIERIERREDTDRAYFTKTFEHARGQAQAAERAVAAGDALGPLHGLPVAIKDLFDTAGVRTTSGSEVLADNVPQTTATAVARLQEAGAIMLGKTELTEFAGIAHHPKRSAPGNPFDAGRTSGGSSSGSAVATSAGLCGASLGSDTVASIRLPAAWTGCIGLKPTWGRISRHGAFPLSHTYDHVGPLTRTVADAALMLGVMAGHDPLDPTSLRHTPSHDWPRLQHPSRLRVGYDEHFVTERTFPSVAACVTDVLSHLQEGGADIVPVTIPMTDRSAPPYNAILKADVARAHRHLYPERDALYGPEHRDLLQQAQHVSVDELGEAHLFRIAFQDAIADLFTRVDLLVMPTVPLPAPPNGGQPLWNENLLSFLRYTYHWNQCGVPAIALPWGLDDDGMPHSVQLVGPHGHEERILSVASAIERPIVRPPELD